MKRRAREKAHEKAVLTRKLRGEVEEKHVLSACLTKVSVAAQIAGAEQSEWWTTRAKQYADDLHEVMAEKQKCLSDHEEHVRSVEMYLYEKLRDAATTTTEKEENGTLATTEENGTTEEGLCEAVSDAKTAKSEFTLFDEFIWY